jgi:transposase-like protein
MMLERDLHVDHTTIYRCVHHYAPELEKRGPPHLKATNHWWRLDDDLYQSEKGVDVSLSSRGASGEHSGISPQPTRIAQAAKRFFSRALDAPQILH